MKHSFLFAVSLILFSCSGRNNVPSEIIKQGEMQNILWDILKAQALSSEISKKDSTINELAEIKVLNQKIFLLHNITNSDFDKSYAWYTNHPDVLKVIFDSLSNKNQRENELKRESKKKPLKLDSLKKVIRKL